MEQNPFGVHVMDNEVNESRMWAYLDAALPAASLFFNNHQWAQAAKARYPGMTVLHRTYNPNDQRWHEVTTPAQWVAAHSAHGANGVIVACYNEPAGDWNNAEYRDALINFCIGAVDEADKAGIRLALPNFSVGNPLETRIMDGSFDRLIRRVAGSRHIFAVHEYWHTNPVNETPYLINRISFWQQRTAALGLSALNIVITEHGMDKGGGRGDGWRDQGISAEAYADQFIVSRSRYPTKPPTCIFGFGNGFGWNSFNVDDPTILGRLQHYREDVPVPEEPTPPSFEPCIVTKIEGNAVNIRQLPTTTSRVIGTLRIGDHVTADVTTLIDGQEPDSKWYRTQNGYVAQRYKGQPISVITRAIAVPQPIVMLDVPFVSQLGSDAKERSNDCFIASALMVFKWKLKQAGFGDCQVITVDGAIKKSPLANDDNPVTLAEGLQFMTALGLTAEIVRPLNLPRIVALVDEGIVPIPLVRYKHIKPGDAFEGGHYLAVIGYGTSGFWVNDSYNGGMKWYVPNERMELALTDLGVAAALPYQGIVTT